MIEGSLTHRLPGPGPQRDTAGKTQILPLPLPEPGFSHLYNNGAEKVISY